MAAKGKQPSLERFGLQAPWGRRRRSPRKPLLFNVLDRAIRTRRARLIMIGEGSRFRVYRLRALEVPHQAVVVKRSIHPIETTDNKSYGRALESAGVAIRSHQITGRAVREAPASDVINKVMAALRRHPERNATLLGKSRNLLDLNSKLLRLQGKEVRYYDLLTQLANPNVRGRKRLEMEAGKLSGAAGRAELLRRELAGKTEELKHECYSKVRGKERWDVMRAFYKRPPTAVPKLFGVQMTFDVGPVQVFERAPHVVRQQLYTKHGGEAIIGDPTKWEEYGYEFVGYAALKRAIPKFARLFVNSEKNRVPLDIHPGNFAIDLRKKRLLYIDSSETRDYPVRLERAVSAFLLTFGANEDYRNHVAEMRDLLLDEVGRHVPAERLERIRRHANAVLGRTNLLKPLTERAHNASE